jgi:hypothetical protein
MPVAVVAILLLAAYLALFPAPAAVITARLVRRSKGDLWRHPYSQAIWRQAVTNRSAVSSSGDGYGPMLCAP